MAYVTQLVSELRRLRQTADDRSEAVSRGEADVDELQAVLKRYEEQDASSAQIVDTEEDLAEARSRLVNANALLDASRAEVCGIVYAIDGQLGTKPWPEEKVDRPFWCRSKD